jgi:hypothetical protein
MSESRSRSRSVDLKTVGGSRNWPLEGVSSVPLSLVLPELVMNPRPEPQKSFTRPQNARSSLVRSDCAAQFARIVGLRQSLVEG